MGSNDKIEKILWSIAFPGFGQVLNKEFVKGLGFVILEILINLKSNLNQAIISSFQGNTGLAVNQTDYHWLMFYPCIYMFAIWDTYINAKGVKASYSFIPFITSAFLGTIGVIYSSVLKINDVLLGPVFLPIICLILGALIGIAIYLLLSKYIRDKR